MFYGPTGQKAGFIGTAEPGCISIAWRETRCQHPPARSERWRAESFKKCASDAASPARTEALKKAGLLRHQAELRSLVIEGARKTDACHPQAMMLAGSRFLISPPTRKSASFDPYGNFSSYPRQR